MPFVKGRKKTGGRQKGTPNKFNARALAEKLGFDPLEMLFNIARGEGKSAEINMNTRVQIAIQLIPYVYPKLSSIQVSGDLVENSKKDPCEELSDEELDEA